ncbi:MAG: transporter [Deltaproteobacteria bacterium]|nr:MAG: transporter [Deltaproteobacteria bacterium]
MSLRVVVACIGAFGWVATASAQELEPRRWTHLPTGTHFFGVGYAYTEGDLFFDPILEIEDATVRMHTVALKYIRTFEVLGKSARVDLVGAYQDGSWKGLLEGAPARADRSGFADPELRLAINLFGAPPLQKDEFAQYRKGIESETIAGAALAVNVPLGEYFDDKLINLGTNRFTIRPQLGLVHNRGKWGTELTGAVWFFTDNDDFFGDARREQDPLFAVQGHLVYTFRPGLWLACGVGYGHGGESTIDGDRKDDETQNLVFGASLGIPITRYFGLKIGYLGTRTQNDTGLDSDSLVTAASLLW